jgi:hypothetical protein
MNSRRKDENWRWSDWVMAVGLGVAILMSSPAWSEDRGRCVRAEAPWPVVLPDGSSHEAGSVKLCLQQMWTPASGLHEIRLNGTAIGLFMSRATTSEGPAERMPIVVFQRTDADEHRLVGYAWPDGEAMRVYMLHRFGKAPAEIAWKSQLPLVEDENTEILMAALTR